MSTIREFLENCGMSDEDIEFILFEGTNADRRVKQKKVDPSKERRQKTIRTAKTFRLPEPLVRWLEIASAQKQMDQTECIEQALRLWAVVFHAQKPPGIDWGEEQSSSYEEVRKDLKTAGFEDRFYKNNKTGTED